MEILLWLLPSAVITGAAMAWVSWAGRARPERERSQSEHDRFAAAIMRPIPGEQHRSRTRERSTGVAVRRQEAARQTRRSA